MRHTHLFGLLLVCIILTATHHQDGHAEGGPDHLRGLAGSIEKQRQLAGVILGFLALRLQSCRKWSLQFPVAPDWRPESRV